MSGTDGRVLSRTVVFGRDGATVGGDIPPPGRRLSQGGCLRCPHRGRRIRPIGVSLVGDLSPDFARRVSDGRDWFGNLFRSVGCVDLELERLRLRVGRGLSASEWVSCCAVRALGLLRVNA
jgi:hypothetical protein